MTDDPVKRLNYFDNQFLHAKDFNDEQEYHISMRRLHNSVLHTSGVAQGLELVVNSDNKSVTIKPGVAVDALGQESWLKKEQIKDVSSFKNKTVFVTIKYADGLTDETEETGAEGDTRWTEKPVTEVKKTLNPLTQDPKNQELILGQVIVDGNGNISRVDDGVEPNRRRLAGAKGGDMEMRTLTLTGSGEDSFKWPELSSGAENCLNVTTSVVVVSGDLQANKLVGTLGDKAVGADQIIDGAVTAEKLSGKIPLEKLSRDDPSSTIRATTSINPLTSTSEAVDSFPCENPLESYLIVFAYSKIPGAQFYWMQYLRLDLSSPHNIGRYIRFTNETDQAIQVIWTARKLLY